MIGPRARATAIGIVIAVVLLATAEGVVRWLGVADDTGSESWLVFDGELGWRRRPGFEGVAFGSHRRFDAEGLHAIDTRQADSPRKILVLGDSRAFANEVDAEESFAEVLDRELPEWSVINLGTPGYSAVQGLASLERFAPRLEPEVVVLAFGFNDRRYVLSPDQRDGADHFRRLASPWPPSLHLVRWLRSRATPAAAPLDLRSVEPRVDPAGYRRALEETVERSRRWGIRPIFLLLSDNPAQSADLEAGDEEALERAIASDNVFSDAARLALASLLRARGRHAEADRVGSSPGRLVSSSGGYPLLPDTPYLEIARDVAGRYGVTVVDATIFLDAHPEVFLDFCHFGPVAHRTIAGLIHDALQQEAAASSSSVPGSLEEAPGHPRRDQNDARDDQDRSQPLTHHPAQDPRRRR